MGFEAGRSKSQRAIFVVFMDPPSSTGSTLITGLLTDLSDFIQYPVYINLRGQQKPCTMCVRMKYSFNEINVSVIDLYYR